MGRLFLGALGADLGQQLLDHGPIGGGAGQVGRGRFLNRGHHFRGLRGGQPARLLQPPGFLLGPFPAVRGGQLADQRLGAAEGPPFFGSSSSTNSGITRSCGSSRCVTGTFVQLSRLT